jgi:glycosyltransferase involved in cell wall biosynthesis
MSTMTIPDFAGIKKIIQQEKPNCLHIFSPIGMAEKIALKYARHHNIPVVVTNHIMPENFTYNVQLPRNLQLLADKLIYKDLIKFCNKAQIVTAPTKTAINLLLNHGLKTKYEVITNGVDAEYFHPGKPNKEELIRFKLESNHPFILYIGRLDGEKRVDILIKAMPFILKRIPQAKLIIAGKGIQRNELNNLVSELKLKDAIGFLGKVSEEEKRALLQSATVFAIASPSELQCISGLEALSCGLPVVVADQMALTELVDHEKNGLLFHYPDAKNLADHICSLFEDTKLRETYGKNGREWILQHHQLAHALKLFEKIYHQAIADFTSGPFLNKND